MQFRKMLCMIFALTVLFSFCALCQQPAAAAVAQQQAEVKKAPPEKYIVYYFMTTTRCPSCHKIETYTHTTVMDKFAAELNGGTMEWKMVNTDEAANEHFIKDYNLFTKSVIISKVVDGKEVSWKYLDKVWDLLSNQEKFQKYIESEIRAFMKEKK
jgi:hypothetical protein